jgi:hypothetical protein
MLWSVRGTRAAAGLLQQSYAAAPATPEGQVAPLVGERKTDITLHLMSDKEEGSASKEKHTAPPFTITAIKLKLKATTT